MPKFEDDILRPEEEAAGFNPGEPDDDTFMIKDDEDYPGEMLSFDETKTLEDHKINTALESGDLDEIDESIGEDLELDSELQDAENSEFEESIENESENELAEEQPNDSSIGSVWDAFDTEKDDTALGGDESEGAAQGPKVESGDLEEFASARSGYEFEEDEDLTSDPTEQPEKEDLPAMEESEVEVDDELRNLIRGELDKSEERKKEKEVLETEERDLAEKAAANKKEDPFSEVDSMEDAKEIDLNMIDVDRPSKYYEKETDAESDEIIDEITKEQEEIKHDKKAEKDEAQAKIEKLLEEKEKQKKKKFPILAVASTAIVTLLLAGGAFLIYFFYFTDTEIKINDEVAETAKDTTADLSVNAKSNSEADVNQDIIDTVEVDEELTIADEELDKIFDEEDRSEKERIESKTQDNKVDNERVSQKQNNDNINQFQSTSTNISKDQRARKQESKKSEAIKEAVKQTVTETDNAQDSLIKQEAIAETFITDGETAVEPQIEDKAGLYKVQVYSSLSFEDATEWKKRLERMNIDKVEISKQKIRDKIWYRVRFGEFSTRIEARTAASLYGFSQTWIDRVK